MLVFFLKEGTKAVDYKTELEDSVLGKLWLGRALWLRRVRERCVKRGKACLALNGSKGNREVLFNNLGFTRKNWGVRNSPRKLTCGVPPGSSRETAQCEEILVSGRSRHQEMAKEKQF